MSTQQLRALPRRQRPSRLGQLHLALNKKELIGILSSVQAGNCCRVLGPRYRAKSELMCKAASVLQEQGTHYTSYQSLADVRHTDVASFFADLSCGFERDFSLAETTEGHSPPTSASEFQYTLLRVLRSSDRNLALFVDDLEKAPPNFVASLLGALRATFQTVINRPGARLQAVVCGSLSFNEVALDSASPFENISDLVLIGDLDEEERYVFARQFCEESGLMPTTEGLQTLLEHTGGDRFLIERVSEFCFEQMNRTGKKEVTPTHVAECIGLLLDRQLDSKVIEVLRQLESDPSLLSCALRILDQGEVSSADLPIATHETPNQLDLCGVFSRKGERYSIKCQLWAHLLRKRLSAARVGGLYAIAGYWTEAIEYFGRAVREGQLEAKSELLTATINAIYASEDVSRGWSYLGQGLQAAYPDSDLRLYCRSDQALRLVFPDEKAEHHKLILLGGSRYPEIVEALRGPDYSVWASEDTRFLLPVRVGSVGTFSIGLASVGRLKAQSSPFQQREEILQFVRFLQQAARAIESRMQFTSLLRAAEVRSDKLRVLNRTLTSVLHQGDLSEEAILRVVVGAGITSGWGLGYNRCALFMPDESRKVLTVCLGVGHLTREEAETDWETFPYQNLDELIDDLVAGRAVETSLHRRIKSLVFPLETDQHDLLVRCYGGREPVHSSAQQPRIEALPKELVAAIHPPNEFSLVPLTAGDQVLGVLYVDNKFSGTEIDSERFELLKTFANQVALILENARAHAALECQLEELEKLHQVSQVVTSTLEMQNVLDKIVKLGAGVPSDYTSIVLVGEGGDLYTSAEDFPGVSPLHVRARPNGITRRVIATGEVQSFDEVFDDETHNPELIRARIRSYVGVPVKLRDKVLGVLFVHSLSPNAFEGQISLLTTFANWAAIAVENARLYEKAQQLAALEERNWLAQELHDWVNGTIFSIVYNAQAASDMIESDPNRAKEQIRIVQEIAQAAQGEMRSLLLELRPTALGEVGLVSALQRHIDVIKTRFGLPIDFSVHGDRSLPETVEQCLYRVAQEALLNVVKHAEAQRAGLVLELEPDIVSLTVEDNGMGFDPESAIGEKALGLLSMQERVEKLLGSFRVVSEPRRGTRLKAVIPLRKK
jgi:signal transduction histidine kinase